MMVITMMMMSSTLYRRIDFSFSGCLAVQFPIKTFYCRAGGAAELVGATQTNNQPRPLILILWPDYCYNCFHILTPSSLSLFHDYDPSTIEAKPQFSQYTNFHEHWTLPRWNLGNVFQTEKCSKSKEKMMSRQCVSVMIIVNDNG